MQGARRAGDRTVARLLRENGYSLQAPNESIEGAHELVVTWEDGARILRS